MSVHLTIETGVGCLCVHMSICVSCIYVSFIILIIYMHFVCCACGCVVYVCKSGCPTSRGDPLRAHVRVEIPLHNTLRGYGRRHRKMPHYAWHVCTSRCHIAQHLVVGHVDLVAAEGAWPAAEAEHLLPVHWVGGHTKEEVAQE